MLDVTRKIGTKRRGNRARPEAATIDDVMGRHRRIAQLVACGLPPKVIAEKVGMTAQGVLAVLRSPIVAQHVKSLQAGNDAQAIDVHAEIRGMIPAALQVLDECISDTEQPMRLRSDRALQVLAIAGYGPQRNVNVRADVRHAVLSTEQIIELRQAADKALGMQLIEEVAEAEIEESVA